MFSPKYDTKICHVIITCILIAFIHPSGQTGVTVTHAEVGEFIREDCSSQSAASAPSLDVCFTNELLEKHRHDQ